MRWVETGEVLAGGGGGLSGGWIGEGIKKEVLRGAGRCMRMVYWIFVVRYETMFNHLHVPHHLLNHPKPSSHTKLRLSEPKPTILSNINLRTQSMPVYPLGKMGEKRISELYYQVWIWFSAMRF